MSTSWWARLRVVFLVGVLAGAWWSWQGLGGEIARAFAGVEIIQLAGAGVLVVCGLVITGFVWRIALQSLGIDDFVQEVVPPFFVAQLGKYIPGSIWSFAAQGALGSRRGLPVRVPTTAALLFLGIHVASGLALAGTLGWGTPLPVWALYLSMVLGALGLLPVVYRVFGTALAGRDCSWDAGTTLRAAFLMVPAWCCYSLALVLLLSVPTYSMVLTLGCAFALAHAAGVVVPLAPAGLGAREGAFVVLLAPVVGTGQAAAVALLARLLHTVADFVVAGASTLLMRRSSAGLRRPGGRR